MLAETAARDTLEQVMSEAFRKSGSKKSVVRAVCLGVSGVNHPHNQARILNWLRLVLVKCRAVYTKFMSISSFFTAVGIVK